jgi:hypothetical protein
VDAPPVIRVLLIEIFGGLSGSEVSDKKDSCRDHAGHIPGIIRSGKITFRAINSIIYSLKTDTIMKRNVLAWLGLPALLLLGCLKDPDFEQLSSNFVVVTKADSIANFSNYKTYYISDTLGLVSDNVNDTILIGTTAQALVNAVKQNLNARGYTFVPKGAHPDIGVNLGIIKTTNVGVVYPGWWYGYPGWWDPWYWGGYYPYYYPWSYYYVVETGTLIVDLIDQKNSNATHTMRVLWTAFAGGALGSDVNANVQRGVDAINQSFTQSSYIKRN